MGTEFDCTGMQAHWDEVGGRILLGHNRPWGDRAAAYRASVCWSLFFNWTPVFLRT